MRRTTKSLSINYNIDFVGAKMDVTVSVTVEGVSNSDRMSLVLQPKGNYFLFAQRTYLSCFSVISMYYLHT